MLKLTYTEAGLHMERVATSLEVVVAQRVILAVRFGQPLFVEPGRAAFLLPAAAPELAHLTIAIQLMQSQAIAIAPVDEQFVEVSVWGSWIAATAEAHEGAFITALSDRAEFFIYKLWQATQAQVLA
jgi:hypothetical protein